MRWKLFSSSNWVAGQQTVLFEARSQLASILHANKVQVVAGQRIYV